MAGIQPRTYRALTRRDIDRIVRFAGLTASDSLAMKAVSAVLPFRANRYVVEELVRWKDGFADPIFQLTFPQRGMLDDADFQRMVALIRRDSPNREIRAAAREIQRRLNPHPDGQLEQNVPHLDGRPVRGMQHKYRETVLFFPSQGQICHAYCTYCFRWAQFVGIDELKFANREVSTLLRYLRAHPEVTDVLITGGDPLVMRARTLRAYVEPLLELRRNRPLTLRIGTKAPAFWPYRFLTDHDAADLMRLFEQVVESECHLALMAHYSHPRELSTEAAQEALRRIRRTGAVVRCQAPLVRHVNDRPELWSEMWDLQVRLGAVPYYMFVERVTGPRQYFEVPLSRALDIFVSAYGRVSGLARTVRGPSMSAEPGKVLVDGVARIAGEKVFVLKFLQARDPSLANRVFFARYDPEATWLHDLRPVFDDRRFTWEPVGPPAASHLTRVG